MKRADRVRASFGEQVATMERLGSPFMAQLMRLMAERLTPTTPLTEHVLTWPGAPEAQADNISMRLAGGLHSLVISGADPALAALYPPNTATDDALWEAISTAFVTHSQRLLPWLERPPQTNEIRRASVVIPAMHIVAAQTGLPLAMWELGCSAGLSLRADQFHLRAGQTAFGPADSVLRLAPQWQGTAPAPTALEIIERRGVDLAPMDPTLPEHRLRLLSYLWPDQPERRGLSEAAIALTKAHPARTERADALDWLARTLAQRPRGAATFLFHTVAWQYLSPEARARGDAMIAAEGARTTPDAPLARFGMEGDGGPEAALTLTLWPNENRLDLGRADFHGRSVRWTL